MSGLEAIRDGIKARLDTIDGLNSYASPPGSIMAPAAVVALPTELKPHSTFGGTGVGWQEAHEFRIFVYCPLGMNEDLRSLAAFVDVTGASSIPAAIEGDDSLNGAVGTHGSAVLKIQTLGLQPYAVEDGNYYDAAVVYVTVKADRT